MPGSDAAKEDGKSVTGGTRSREKVCTRGARGEGDRGCTQQQQLGEREDRVWVVKDSVIVYFLI